MAISTIHAVRRTSTKGQPFIGTCTQCGRDNIPLADLRSTECPNVRGVSYGQALAEAIDPEKGN